MALSAQVQAHLEFLDELLAAYGSATRVLLVGHSIGSWFVQEMLKARAALRLRVGAFMLFPTISHIARTPNGRMLSVRVSTTLSPPLSLSFFVTLPLTYGSPLVAWCGVQLVFRPPWPRALAFLSHLVPIPLCMLGFLQRSWPGNQLQVLHAFLRAPAAIYAALTMANDEMQTVRELDADFLREFAQNLWFYYAEDDGWVGEQRAVVLRAVHGTPAESHVVLGVAGIPHAFCISATVSFLRR